jgi:hypothetical protein
MVPLAAAVPTFVRIITELPEPLTTLLTAHVAAVSVT